MRQALLILRKDIRHLWWRAAIFAVLEALFAMADAAVPRVPVLGTAGWLSGAVLQLAAAFLVVSVIHEDRLVGDRQFWITRPYSWKSLALAKGLFLLLFINLPVLLGQSAALAANGFSPMHYLPQLLDRQVSLTAGTLLIWVGIAAVTANLVQAVIAILSGYLLLVLSIMVLSRIVDLNFLNLGSTASLFKGCQTAMMLLLIVGACWLLYRRRVTVSARGLAACCIALSFFPLPVAPWGAAFALVEARSPSVDPSAVRLAPDYSRTMGSPSNFPLEPGKLPILVPIEIANIPDGMEVYSESAKISLQAPDGKSWSSGWHYNDELLDQGKLTRPIYRLLPGAGSPYWLQANVGEDFLKAQDRNLLHVRATVALTLLGPAQIVQMKAFGRRESLAGDGFCNLSKTGQSATTSCFALLRRPTLSLVRIEPPAQFRVDPIVDGNLKGMETSSRGENAFSIWEILSGGVAYGAIAQPSTVSIETRQAVAHFERTLDMPGVRLEYGRR